MKRLIILSLLASVFCASAGIRYRGDFLMPCEGIFDDPYGSIGEWVEVRSALLDSFPYHAEAKFYCIPAFSGPYGWAIENVDGSFLLRATELSKSLSEIGPRGYEITRDESGEDVMVTVPSDPTFEVTRYRKILDADLAVEIRDTWSFVLKKTRYPSKQEIEIGWGLDGADYYFSASPEDPGILLSGTVWSPVEDINPTATMMVEAAEIVFRIARDESDVDLGALKSILRKIRKESQPDEGGNSE